MRRSFSNGGLTGRLLLVIGIAVFAAGCGGGSKTTGSDFKAGATAATAAVTQLGKDLGTAIQGAGSSSDSQLAATFGALSGRARSIAGDLRALKAPDAARKATAEALASSLSLGATQLDAVTTAVRSGNAAAAQTATQTLVSGAAPAIKVGNAALKDELKTGSGY